MVYEDNRWHNYILSLYILVVPTIKDFITRLTWLVSCRRTQRQIYNHFWTLRASTHERPPCVLRHTGNAYVVSHIFTHTLPSTIEMAPKRSTLNGQRCICHITYSLPVHSPYGTSKGRRVPRVTVMANHMTGLHLVTLPYEMAVITITRHEIRTPYQAADSDMLI